MEYDEEVKIEEAPLPCSLIGVVVIGVAVVGKLLSGSIMYLTALGMLGVIE